MKFIRSIAIACLFAGAINMRAMDSEETEETFEIISEHTSPNDHNDTADQSLLSNAVGENSDENSTLSSTNNQEKDDIQKNDLPEIQKNDLPVETLITKLEEKILTSTTNILNADIERIQKAFIGRCGGWINHLPSNNGIPGMAGDESTIVVSRALMRLFKDDLLSNNNYTFYTPQLMEHITGSKTPTTHHRTRKVFKAITLQFTPENLAKNMEDVMSAHAKESYLTDDVVQKVTTDIQEKGHTSIYFAQEATRIMWKERQSMINQSIIDYQHYSSDISAFNNIS